MVTDTKTIKKENEVVVNGNNYCTVIVLFIINVKQKQFIVNRKLPINGCASN